MFRGLRLRFVWGFVAPLFKVLELRFVSGFFRLSRVLKAVLLVCRDSQIFLAELKSGFSTLCVGGCRACAFRAFRAPAAWGFRV